MGRKRIRHCLSCPETVSLPFVLCWSWSGRIKEARRRVDQGLLRPDTIKTAYSRRKGQQQQCYVEQSSQ